MTGQELAETEQRRGVEAAKNQAKPCPGKDPLCPCQDGDACHYKDSGDTKAWPIPESREASGE